MNDVIRSYSYKYVLNKYEFSTWNFGRDTKSTFYFSFYKFSLSENKVKNK